jgi:microcystin-dependent protein
VSIKLLGPAPSGTTDAVRKTDLDAVVGIKFVATVTGSITATANTFHLVNLAGSLGTITATLPAAPPQGTQCEFIRQDANAATSTFRVVPGGSDTVVGTNPFVIVGANTGAKFIYIGTAWVIHENTTGSTSAYWPTSAAATLYPAPMARDSGGRAEIVAPDGSNVLHVVNKQYVDGNIRLVNAGITTSLANRDIALVDATSAARTMSLPVAAGNYYVIKKVDSSTNIVTVTGVTGTIDGDASLFLTGQDASAIVLCDGTNFQIIAAYGGAGQAVPTGVIDMFGGSVAPTGWLLCDGSSVLRATYPNLFAVIGTAYGSVDGTHFTLPTFANLFPRGNTPGLGGGADTHTHTSAAHAHTLSDAGQAQVALSATAVAIRNVASAAWTETDRDTGLTGSTTNSTSLGVGLMGSTDSATPGATGSASNVPANTGVAFIIKT